MSFGKARVWEETVTIPTYGVGTPNKNPMFLEKRVYQGSSGRVYPHPVTDKIFDEKADKAYRAIFWKMILSASCSCPKSAAGSSVHTIRSAGRILYIITM